MMNQNKKNFLCQIYITITVSGRNLKFAWKNLPGKTLHFVISKFFDLPIVRSYSVCELVHHLPVLQASSPPLESVCWWEGSGMHLQFDLRTTSIGDESLCIFFYSFVTLGNHVGDKSV